MTFNLDGGHDGVYRPGLDTLLLTGDTLLVELATDGFLAADLDVMTADLAALLPGAILMLNEDLEAAGLGAEVDPTRPGLVVAHGRVRLFLRRCSGAPDAPRVTGKRRAALPGEELPAVQLPGTQGERQGRVRTLRRQFPQLPLPLARSLVVEAARQLRAVGCRSAAELASRADRLCDELALPLSRTEARDALLAIAFGRFPAREADRELLLTALVAAWGGPVGTTAVDADDGPGMFGRCVENPVPVAGVVSNGRYMARLRTLEGWGLHWQRIGSNIGDAGPVDRYVIEDLLGRPQGEVFLCPYHQHISTRPPEGLQLLPEE